MGPGPVLLYDGQCDFCSSTIQWILRHDPHGSLRFAPLEGALGGAIRVRHPAAANADSLLWFEPARDDTPEQLRTRSDAALHVARYLGGVWRLGLILAIIPRPLRDAAYDLIATHRHRLARGGPQCVMPTAAQRARFLLDGADA